jgi:LmbE family N-acetylglucosaminyl deacetylase
LSSVAGRLLGASGKRRVGRIAEALWGLGFLGARAVAPRRRVSHEIGRFARVLVVAPHPDDESIGCGGAILLHRQSRTEVIVICVTDGRTSRAFQIAPDDMASRRRIEANACADALDVKLEWLGLPGDAWTDADLTGRLDQMLSQHEPQLVYASSRIDFHPEHRRVARVLASSLMRVAPAATVRIYPVQVPLTAALANVVVDVTPMIDRLHHATDAYATQVANIPRMFRQRRYAAIRHGCGRYAEEFWEMSAGDYARLHADDAPHGVDELRGVRAQSLYDPIAYLAGRAERRRLRTSIASAGGPA